MSKVRLFARLTKIDEACRKVYGVIASEGRDRAGERFDYDTSKQHFMDWSDNISKATDGKSLGNVRVMHGKIVAGRATQVDYDDVAKTISIEADIVDDAEWNKVSKGLYTGFSIGGKYGDKWDDPVEKGVKRYTAIPHEVSLVDLPCNADATFAVMKGEGIEEERAFDETVATGEQPLPDAEDEAGEQTGGAEGGDATATTDADAAKGAGIEDVNNTPAEGSLREVDGVIEKFAGGQWSVYGEVNKATGADVDLAKGAYSIGCLARLAEDVHQFCNYRSFEAWDGKSVKEIPAALKAAAINLYDALVEVVNADAAKAKEQIAEKLADMGDLRKAMGGDEEEIAKVIGIHGELLTLAKAVGVETIGELGEGIAKVTANYATLQAQHTELRKQFDAMPAPTKGVLKVVGRTDDVSEDDGNTATASGEQTPEDVTKAAFAAALSKPINMDMRS